MTKMKIFVDDELIKEEEVFSAENWDEISDNVRENIFSKHGDMLVDYGWWEFIYDDAKNVGLKISSFDLGGASYVKGDFLLSANEVAQNIINEHGDICETHKTAQNFLDEWSPVFADYLDENSENYESYYAEQELQDLEDEFLKSLCEDYRIILQKEYDYLTSEESVVETFKANEYVFDKWGNIVS